MIDPLQAFLEANGLRGPMFPPTSRYHGLSVAHTADANGQPVLYVRRRFVPGADRFTTIAEHAVVQGDRLENLSHRYLGDAELYWRLADANTAMRPAGLTDTAGVRVRITLPEGMPGGSGD
jgi:hypothetical protein